jgi:hypothetical protein
MMIRDQQKDAVFVQVRDTLLKGGVDPVTALEVLAGLMAALIAHMDVSEAMQKRMCKDIAQSMMRLIKTNSIRH